MADAEGDPFEMTQFGIFYPRGHMVVAFQSEEGARKVQHDLLTGGYDASDCVLVPAEEVARNAQKNLEDHCSSMRRTTSRPSGR